MQHSAEIRWFFQGSAPREVMDWFENSLGSREKKRDDEYLVLPHCRTVSVKVREGKLEVKAQREPPQLVDYGGAAEGYRDLWVKWSRPAADMPELRRLIGSGKERWIFVEKRRFLRKFSLDPGAPLEVRAAEDRPAEGCGVELTHLIAKLGQPYSPSEAGWEAKGEWWSFSFESFADPLRVQDNLERVAGTFFEQNHPPIPLAAETSESYPVWLSRLAESEQSGP